MNDTYKRQFILDLTDDDTRAFYDKCQALGTTPAELLTDFVNNYVDGQYSRGSDERRLANEYVDRCIYRFDDDPQTFVQWAVEYGYIETLRDIIETMDDARGDIEYYAQHPDDPDGTPDFIQELQGYKAEAESELHDIYNEYAADQRNRPVQSFKEAIPALQAYLLERDTAVSDHDGELFTRHFYTVPQAAALLQVHENTVYRWTRSRSITFYKIGQQIRIPADELKRMKEERLN